MMTRKPFLDTGSLIVAAMTLLLFVAALFMKGITHDLFIEAGVFLVSVKIILMAHRNSIATSELNRKLDELRASLERTANTKNDGRNLDATRRHEAMRRTDRDVRRLSQTQRYNYRSRLPKIWTIGTN